MTSPALARAEKTFFFALLFFLPFQTRFILVSEPAFLEWTSISLWGTDILLLGLMLFWFSQRPTLSFSKADFALGVFVGMTFVSALAAENRALGFYAAGRVAEMAIFFYYLEHNLRRYKLSFIITALLAAGVLQAFLGIGQFALQSDLGLLNIEPGALGGWIYGVANFFTASGKYIRAYGTTPHPNVLAVFLLGTITVLLRVIARSPERSEGRRGNLGAGPGVNLAASDVLQWGILFLLIFAFFLTFSRAVITVGSVGLFAYVLWRFASRRSDILTKLKAANVLLVVLASYALVIGLLWPELKARFQFSRREEAVEFRIASSESAWDIIKKYPLLGVGPGNFIPHIRQFAEDAPRFKPADGLQPVHNLYLLVASETGVLGFVAFVAFFAFLAFQFWRAKPGLRAPLVIFLVTLGLLAGADHYFWTLQQGRLLWWLGWGIIAACGRKMGITSLGSFAERRVAL